MKNWSEIAVSTHSRPKAAGRPPPAPEPDELVSTHSRPKAAGPAITDLSFTLFLFQHTAARRRLVNTPAGGSVDCVVSTHSRPKAAGYLTTLSRSSCTVSTHSRPKAAGVRDAHLYRDFGVSTHSRPKAAGWDIRFGACLGEFQHTAARRRLVQRTYVQYPA